MIDDRCRIGTRLDPYAGYVPVHMARDDLRRHLYVIGRTGVGKTSLLKTLIFDDLVAGRAFALLDPLGPLAETVVDTVPVYRTDDVIYWNPGGDREHLVGFNPLFDVPPEQRALVADNLVEIFNHIWGSELSSTPRLIYVLTYALRLLLDTPETTLLGLPRLLVDDRYRERLVERCDDPVVVSYWQDEFAAYGDRFRAEVIAPVQTRIGTFLGRPALRDTLGQPHSTLNIDRLLGNGDVLIVNLSKGLLGETGSHLLGALLATRIAQAAEQRSARMRHRMRDFTLYCDELHNVATPAFAGMLAESRNHRLAFCGAHQYLRQLDDQVREAVLGTIGSTIAFRVGAEDARVLGQELDLSNPQALMNSRNFTAWSRLLTDGEPGDPFLLHTEDPRPPASGRKPAVVSHTRQRLCRPKAIVDDMIRKQLRPSRHDMLARTGILRKRKATR